MPVEGKLSEQHHSFYLLFCLIHEGIWITNMSEDGSTCVRIDAIWDCLGNPVFLADVAINHIGGQSNSWVPNYELVFVKMWKRKKFNPRCPHM